MHTVYAPGPVAGSRPYVFLAGSIDQGRAEPWQQRVIDALDRETGTVLNPRRPDWDDSWRQSIDDPRFREQVEWELDMLGQADVIAMYFAAGSRAPITLLELGLYAGSGKLIVGCPEEYWRRGNVEIVCRRFGAGFVASLDELLAALVSRLRAGIVRP